ncbi:MAG TPA: two-component regulator propeller domain-containing protein [Opitutaceae bacterium]|nr:two-component regulator propeller domain-containing protein [Opitutaceae bacterium]
MKGPREVRKIVTLVVGILSVACSATGWATETVREPFQYAVDFWREAEGLPQSRIRGIVQTRDGYLWLGSVGGLVRFDGANFTVFNVQTGSLKDNEIWALKEDDEGALWIGTVSGGVTRLKEGRFTTYTTADGLPGDLVLQIDTDRDGQIWIATSRGVARFAGGAFRAFTMKDGLTHDFVIKVCVSPTQGVFAVAANKLHRLANDRFVVVEGVIDETDGRVADLSSGRDGSLWITFERGGIKRLQAGRLTTYTSELNAHNGTIYEDRQGETWLGSRDGLLRLHEGQFARVLPAETNAKLGSVYLMCLDQEGSLWLGLEANGLARLRRTQFAAVTMENGLLQDSIRSVLQDSRGDIWIGTTGGLARDRHGQITTYRDLDGVPIGTVTSIAEDRTGNLWIGASGELYKIVAGKLTKDPTWKRVLDVKTVYCDPQGRMWIGTDGDGLFCYAGDKVTIFRTQDGLPSNQIRGLLTDRQGALWVATFGGGASRLFEGKFTNYTSQDGLGSNWLSAIHEDATGALWFATRGGLSRRQDGRFFTYRTKDGLPTNSISNMLEDERGNFWFSCLLGIFRVSAADFRDVADGKISQLRFLAYGISDGMKTTAFAGGNQPGVCRTSDGRLLFCSLQGLVIVDPSNLFSNTLVPPVYVERVLIDKQSVPPDRPAEIAPGAGEVEIHYTALSYLAPGKVRFKYQLVGFDRDWVEAGTRRFAYYASLPAGAYSFHVVASNNDGVWNQVGASFAFRLQPHFRETGWFYLLCLVGVAGLFGAVYELRVLGLKAREKMLQARVTEAVAKVRVLSGMLPICAGCKKVRDDKGYWNQIETYLREHSDTRISHGLCPDCVRKLYPEFSDEILPPGNAPASPSDLNLPR